MPNSLEAERALIGVCAIDGKDVIPRAIMAGISPSSFYDLRHGIIFAAILDLYAAQKPTETSVVAEHMKATNKLDGIGGYLFLADVTSSIPTTAQAGFFIERVRSLQIVRELARSCAGAVEKCMGFSGDLGELLASVHDSVGSALNGHATTGEESVQATATAIIEELKAPKAQRTGFAGEVSWGLVDIDRRCHKMAPGSLVVLAGKPSSGKSSIADQAAWESARQGVVTLMFSYEMTKRDKVIRIAQQIARLNLDEFEEAPIDRKLAFTEALRSIQRCKALRIYERDTSLNRLIARVRATMQRERVGFIVVDFLQRLARLEPTLGKERTDEKLGRITTALTDLAKECECPVLLLSSLNREGYKDESKPTMSALKNSGDIESDADVIAFLHWPKVNPRTGMEQDPHDENQRSFYVSLIQDKGRNKGVHELGIMFSRPHTRFDNILA